MRFCSSGTILAGEMHEKTLRLRRERREIDDATDARRTIRLHFGGRQFGVRRGLRVRGEQRRACPRNQIERGDGSVVGLSVADHWREHRDIDLRLRGQRPARGRPKPYLPCQPATAPEPEKSDDLPILWPGYNPADLALGPAGMARPYSQDLRDRVIDAVVQGGMSRRGAAARFGISELVAIKWVERFERTGLRTTGKMGGHKRLKLEPHREFLEACHAEKPDVTLQALCDRLLGERGVKADTSLMSRFLRRIGLTPKKRRSSPASRTVRT